MAGLARALGPVGAWGHLDTLASSRLRGYVLRLADAGYGALWVPEIVSRDPYTLLGAVVDHAGDMWLGTCISSIWARDAMASRMAALTLHELTGGRFVLGLGVSHAHLAQRLRGHVYGQPLTRMREYLAAYRSLPYKGPMLPGADGGATEPPIVLAALRDRMLGLAATQTAGAYPYLVTAERIGHIRATLDAATAAVPSADATAASAVVADAGERPLLAVTLPVILESDPGRARSAARAYLAPYLRTPNYQASWEIQGFGPGDWTQPGSDRLADAMTAWGSAGQLLERIAAMHAAGADHVALVPVAPDGTTEQLTTLEALAGRW